MKKLYEIEIAGGTQSDFRFIVKHMGYYAGVRDSNRSSSKLVQNLVDCEEPDSAWLTANVDKVYRLPHLQLSRDKLSILQEKCNFKTTRNIDDAQLVIVGDKTIDKCIKIYWGGSDQMTNDKRTELLEIVRSSKISQEHIDSVAKKLLHIESNSHIMVSNGYYYHSTQNVYTDLIEKFTGSVRSQSRNYVEFVPIEMYEHYNNIVNSNYTYVSDEHMNKLCTEDSIIIDKESFKNIHKLVTSPDKENISVGLSMMANCNEEASKTYLALLFAFDSENMKVSNVWNTVNFKSLRKVYDKYINLSLSQWGHAYDVLIKNMCKDKCLTMFASRVIANTMFKRVLSGYSGAGTRESVFTLNASDLKLKPEFADQLVSDVDTNLTNVINAGSHNDLPF